ncbi:MAG: methionine adenosyltransferase, partial [Bilophila sp.]
LSQQLTKVRKSGEVDFFRPDGKTQISFEYVDGKPVRINNVVVSTQHAASASQADIIEAVKHKVILPILEPSGFFDAKHCEIFINTTGRFVVGGPMGDCGLTGRKIIQDTYGGTGHHGGGAFSGKDPSKVDRSAAYMGRYVAKNVVAAGLAPCCEVQIAYCIGVAQPVSVLVSSLGTGEISDERLTKAVREVFDLRPYHISKRLDLLRPIYKKTSCYGHFGRELSEFTWEKTDAIADLRTAAKM